MIFEWIGYLLFFAGLFIIVYQMLPKQKDVFRKEEELLEEEGKFIYNFRPFYILFFPLIQRIPARDYRKKLKKWAVISGINTETITTDDLIGFQISTAILFGFLTFAVSESHLFIIVAILLGISYPYIWLYEKMKNRQQEIIKGMPDVVDMLALAVQAGGLNLEGAISRVCNIFKKDKNPFVRELMLMSRETEVGGVDDAALRRMAERVDIIQMYSFTSTIIQAQKMGVPIGNVLRTQAELMREERFNRAERIGAYASQKLLIPMMIFIFPLTFIVVLGPYLIRYFSE